MAIKTKLPPDPEGMNDDRAKWGRVAVDYFKINTGVDDEDAISDLVADLMHYCDRNPEYGDGLEQVNRGIRSYMDDCLEWDKQSHATGIPHAITSDPATIDGRNRGNSNVYAYSPDDCPAKHYNDGTDFCVYCGHDLQAEG